MLAERASGTALMVTALRALESGGPKPLFEDEQAICFLPRAVGRTLLLARRFPLGALALRALPDALSPGRQQHIALRTRVIDDLVLGEVGRGTRQLVLLGAGFDTRAYRLPLGAATVFELDHPATQRRKRTLGRTLPARALAHRFVATDFERDELGPRLLEVGFEAERPSLIVWEGVTMYLTLSAVRSTLAAIRALSAPGSRLLVTYHDASGGSGRASHSTAALASLLGERFRSAFSPAEAGALVTEFGFVLETDTGRDDWARAHGRSPRGRAHERLLVARRV